MNICESLCFFRHVSWSKWDLGAMFINVSSMGRNLRCLDGVVNPKRSVQHDQHLIGKQFTLKSQRALALQL